MQTENVMEMDELELDGKFDQPIVLGIQGPPGPQGNHGKPGADGEDGGYYTPAVTQLDEDTIQFNFTPSKEGMPAVAPATVELPVGQGSGGNVDFRVGETLKLENGVLSVNTTNDMEQDNTLPITSAGVYATVGNIEALLKTI